MKYSIKSKNEYFALLTKSTVSIHIYNRRFKYEKLYDPQDESFRTDILKTYSYDMYLLDTTAIIIYGLTLQKKTPFSINWG